ncbi:unnamed protein product [Prorocentrum cordatum]|uniref:Apple domain-containing protein n=1 Tax=Prorocentrum cordatum TaxID=2364126 RepID=A0ABN9VLF1_9DINO|nr:unnamed protein product [Polarella glacialis]
MNSTLSSCAFPTGRGPGWAGMAVGAAAAARFVALAAALQAARAWECRSDVDLGQVSLGTAKGLAMDDTTLRWCSQNVPKVWPNADTAPVSYLRLFKAWDPLWEESDRSAAWDNLKAYCESNGVRVLFGTPLSCDEDDDDQHWEWTKELMLLLGEEHIMGLGIGNELELLQYKGGNVTEECVERIWDGGYLWQRFTAIVSELDAMGMDSVPVTSVFTGAALAGDGNEAKPFMEEPGKALVTTFLRNATEAYGWRYTFTWNLYPYFDPNLPLDAGSDSTCNDALDFAACWGQDCAMASTTRYARWLQFLLTGYKNHTVWIGETGWSFPKSVTLTTPLADCEDWSSMETFQTFYEGFLQWDLTIDVNGDWPPVDAAFWFTIRDSMQFGYPESFGLVDSCAAPDCKLSSQGFQVAAYENFSAPDGTACLGPALFEGFAENGRDECQDRCTQIPSCAFYSFWNSTEWCRLTADCCPVVDGDPVVAVYARQTENTTEACPTPAPPTAPTPLRPRRRPQRRRPHRRPRRRRPLPRPHRQRRPTCRPPRLRRTRPPSRTGRREAGARSAPRPCSLRRRQCRRPVFSHSSPSSQYTPEEGELGLRCCRLPSCRRGGDLVAGVQDGTPTSLVLLRRMLKAIPLVVLRPTAAPRCAGCPRAASGTAYRRRLQVLRCAPARAACAQEACWRAAHSRDRCLRAVCERARMSTL